MRKDDSVKSGSNRRTGLEVFGISGTESGARAIAGGSVIRTDSGFCIKNPVPSVKYVKVPGFLSRQA